MNPVFDTISAYPTLIYTVLLGISLIYWVLAVTGDGRAHQRHDHSTGNDSANRPEDQPATDDSPESRLLRKLAIRLGFGELPFTAIFNLVLLLAWLLTGLVASTLLPRLPTVYLEALVGTATLPLALLGALPVAALIARPLRYRAKTLPGVTLRSQLVGQPCVILTLRVTADFGEAEISLPGTSIRIQVRAPIPNGFTRGSRARITAYDGNRHHYLVAPDDTPGTH